MRRGPATEDVIGDQLVIKTTSVSKPPAIGVERAPSGRTLDSVRELLVIEPTDGSVLRGV